MKKVIFFLVFIGLAPLVVACQNDQNGNLNPYPTLPLPQMRVEKMPTATTTETPAPDVVDLTTPTTAVVQQVQPWPTLDDEMYWLEQIDALLNNIEQELNSTDTRLKP